MKYSILLSLLILGLSLNAQDADKNNTVQTGEKVSAALVQKLGGELKSHMAKNGPVAALGFCSSQAIALTKEVSDTTHYKVKRVTLLDRNPQNRANAEESLILSTWQNKLKEGQMLPAYEIHSDGDLDRFYKPIMINNEACLKCHGAVDPQSELGRAIKAAYPNDRATGYKMGDLRGMIVVDIPSQK